MAANRDFAQTKDGVKLRYEIRGDDDPLALIMGFSGSSRGWGEPFLNLIQKRFKTILIDNRGTGGSDKPVSRRGRWPTMANDVAAVLDHAKIRSHAHLRHLDGRNDRAGVRDQTPRRACTALGARDAPRPGCEHGDARRPRERRAS